VCIAGLAEELPPSPKLQLKEYGAVPPDAEAVKVTCWPFSGKEGLDVKLTVSGGGGFEIETDC